MINHGGGTTDRHRLFLPKRIILVRHGESEGNRDVSTYSTIPDHQIGLTQQGVAQARLAGSQIRRAVSDSGGNSDDWKVYFYVSPYTRTRSTLREVARSFPRKCVIGVREECRIREQDFGNFQVTEKMKGIKDTRQKFGRFFYRFPEGESAADVYDRVSSKLFSVNRILSEIVFVPMRSPFDSLVLVIIACFLESLWRDIDMNRLHHDPSMDLNLIIVTHGLTSRVFLMKWFKWTVEQFEYLHNFGNCEFRVMQLGAGGEYSLSINHSDEEMQKWGMSPEMIAAQKWRAHATAGSNIEKFPWYLDFFLDHVTDDGDDEDNNVDNKSKQL
ncbi:hypothetical protein OSB04_027662 [Centaurea solstitialis]|uniref:Phosphoglycerate mutase-like protein AT74H n=1 Tax=Centaurea solstitialis TaxID=347529 RepID=A0AA38SSK1_9ASTR|nr:hypothetical protein OSB04_027662 [Centaurea solstitialis]